MLQDYITQVEQVAEELPELTEYRWEYRWDDQLIIDKFKKKGLASQSAWGTIRSCVIHPELGLVVKWVRPDGRDHGGEVTPAQVMTEWEKIQRLSEQGFKNNVPESYLVYKNGYYFLVQEYIDTSRAAVVYNAGKYLAEKFGCGHDYHQGQIGIRPGSNDPVIFDLL